jgi:type I restriction enzyme S subunit
LDNKIFSHDVIRINCHDENDLGYIYAYLKSKTGKALLQTNGYGAVITHLEPEHLMSIPVPNPPGEIKKRIHDLVVKSFVLRDESNDLMDEAEATLVKALGLPPLEKLNNESHKHREQNGINSWTVSSARFDNRLDASFHVPIVDTIIRRLKKAPCELLKVGDDKISKKIILPGRFKRVYVSEGKGVTFFGGRSIFELDPTDKKYLSFAKHEKLIRDELTIKENMILVTCSGTIGNVVLVPKHWDNWAMTHDIIRIVVKDEITGYLYIWLQSGYARAIIQSYTYGSVVPHIELEHIKTTPVPLLTDKATQSRINALALEANKKRYEAYEAEQKALAEVEEVIGE